MSSVILNKDRGVLLVKITKRIANRMAVGLLISFIPQSNRWFFGAKENMGTGINRGPYCLMKSPNTCKPYLLFDVKNINYGFSTGSIFLEFVM